MTKMKFKIFKHDSHVWGQRCLDGTTVTFNDQRSQELYRSSRPPAGLKPEINFLKDQNNQSCLISFTTCCCYFHQDWHQDEVEVWLSDDLVGGSGVGILGVTVRGIRTRGGNMWGEGKGLNPLWQNAKKRIRGFLFTTSTSNSVFTKIASSQQGVNMLRGNGVKYWKQSSVLWKGLGCSRRLCRIGRNASQLQLFDDNAPPPQGAFYVTMVKCHIGHPCQGRR